ncbi:MAG TPA: septum formation family protein [Jiangellales bacterium]|nr:septum formation family protein [Jiangellales bacterium]
MAIWGARLRVLLGGGLLALTLAACSLEIDVDRTGGEPTETSASPTVSATSVDAYRVEVGDCLVGTGGDSEELEEVLTVDTVPCDQGHGSEAYAVFDLEDASEYPGDKSVGDLAFAGCEERFAEWVGIEYVDSRLEIYVLHPTEASWTSSEDREVVCLVYDPVAPLTGSARGLGAAAAFQPGTCLDEDGLPTDCAAAHDAEVFAVVSLPEGTWPGQEALETAADEACGSEFEAYVGASYEESALYYGYYTPLQDDWTVGDREVLCFVYDADGPLTGSVRGSGR